jgi:L-alanine-DL-glutamate epimerase-like enolase superfamily enzyme
MPPQASCHDRDSLPASKAPLAIERLEAAAYVVPTDHPESDGTFEWDRTTLVVVEACAGGVRGLGYTYGDLAAHTIAQRTLAPVVVGTNALDVARAWVAMNQAVRNAGRPGVASTALSAVDVALWDLKGRLLEVPLSVLLGTVRDEVDLYGSGGFTSYAEKQLRDQLTAWVESGIASVKMKVGRHAERDSARVRAARAAIGGGVELFVDANGAWSPSKALAMAEEFAEVQVAWFEEPVSSDDLHGLRRVRDRAPAGMAIAAGEYGYDLPYFRRMLEQGAVDVLQADATRCGGITGFLQVAALCEAFAVPLSAHTAPSLHIAPCCAAPCVRHVEYFHDHVRIEQLLFDGAPRPVSGRLRPDWSRPGIGLDLKRADAARYRVA